MLKALNQTLIILSNGKASSEISQFLAGARLIAFEKESQLEDGLPDLRPIAVGEIIKRLFSKILVRSVDVEPMNFFPTQGEVGIPCGTEIVARATHRFRSEFKEYVHLQIDLKNAFNNIRRQT